MRRKQRPLASLLWDNLRDEWGVWLAAIMLIVLAFLFAGDLAVWLEQSAFIRVLDYLSKLGLIAAIIAFLREIPRWRQRGAAEARQRQFAYWQAIDAAASTARTPDGRFFSTALKIALEDLATERDDQGNPLRLQYIDARGANLARIRLAYARLAVCDFPRTDLSRSQFHGAQLDHVNLKGARLFGVSFRDATFHDVQLRYAVYDDATIFPQGYDPAAALAYRIAPNANLQAAHLEHALLWDANLAGANLQGADLRAAIIGGQASNWQQVNLTGANLQHARARGIDLRAANLTRADLSGASLQDALLDGADLTGANLRGSKYLTVEQIKAATNWEHARYDDDVRAMLGIA
ncbi:MAG: pentapeptide repeat-containing protein [Chloroflexales bacterium]